MPRKKADNDRNITMSIRVSEHDIAKIKRACHRDELRPALFAYESLMNGVNKLLKKQEIHGYECSKPI